MTFINSYVKVYRCCQFLAVQLPAWPVYMYTVHVTFIPNIQIYLALPKQTVYIQHNFISWCHHSLTTITISGILTQTQNAKQNKNSL